MIRWCDAESDIGVGGGVDGVDGVDGVGGAWREGEVANRSLK